MNELSSFLVNILELAVVVAEEEPPPGMVKPPPLLPPVLLLPLVPVFFAVTANAV
jgi:hypothetical protein